MVVRIKDIKMFLSIFLFMLPTALFQIPGISTVWYLLLFLSMVFFVVSIRLDFLNIAKKQKGAFSTVLFLVLHILTQALATYYNGGSPMYNLLTASVVFVMCMYVAFYVTQNAIDTIVVFKSVVGFLVFLELVLYVFDLSWLGSIQMGYLYYVVWATMSLFVSKKYKRANKELYIMTILLLLIVTIKPQVNEDGTANYEGTFYVVAFLFMVYLLLEKYTKFYRVIFNPKMIFGIILFLNLVFVVFQSQDKLLLVKFVVEDILHKDIGITGRSGIWNFSKELIKLQPIWGYGTGLIGLKTEGRWYEFLRVYGPHNQFLYMILAGGIFTLLAYVGLLVDVFRKMNKSKNSPYMSVLCLGVLCIYLLLLVTYRTIANSMPFFALLVVISTLCAKDFSFGNDEVQKQNITEAKE